MGIFSKMFGKKTPLMEAEMLTQAEPFLQEIEKAVVSDWQSAKKLIKKRPRDIEEIFDFGKPLQERFANIVLKTIYQAKIESGTSIPQIDFKSLPSVEVFPFHKGDTLSKIIEIAKNSSQNLIYFRDMLNWESYGGLETVVDLEILYEFVNDSRTIFIFHAPARLFIQREFLLDIQSSIPTLTSDANFDMIMSELWEFPQAQKGIKFDECISTTFGWGIDKCYRESW